MGKEFVRMENICKEFPGVKALQDVNFSVCSGEVHALVGENGAGKSTLIKTLMGVHQRTSGEIYVEGKKVEIPNPIAAQELGLAAVYQDVTIAKHLSVAENFFLGRLLKNKIGLVDWDRMYHETQAALDELNIKVDARQLVHSLSAAQQEMVIIAKKFFQHSKLLILDEPTALLANDEVNELFKIIQTLKERGTAIIYISHRMEEIFKVCDNITILKDGHTVTTLKTSETDENDLVSKMVGRDVGDMYSIEHFPGGEVTLEVKDLCAEGRFEHVNMTVRKGEVVGIFGLVGSGRSEIVRAIFGADPVDSGEIILHGKKVDIHNPVDGIHNGISLLPEDRKTQGLALGSSITNNINLASYDLISKLGFINVGTEKQKAQKYSDKLRVVTPSIAQKVINLSGGNQQKVVIGKWLCRESEIFIFDEPTVGIDVGAKSEIYKLMEELLSQGKSVIMISSYLPEIMGLADRIMVITDGGKVMGTLEREEFNDERLLRMASGLETA
ncbi:sugar ABC transporter ATP-binding protein [Chakrabartyella piscis]|uniref:sugar ABC transporter ATP-binding protein n=1 Tax=Chakrabartyella piscis TaxID=2918914 RepID=UPI0029587F5B|nr:sugar ABC transporter ATP-binding protein [Chakrabartyella piscis]